MFQMPRAAIALAASALTVTTLSDALIKPTPTTAATGTVHAASPLLAPMVAHAAALDQFAWRSSRLHAPRLITLLGRILRGYRAGRSGLGIAPHLPGLDVHPTQGILP